MAWPTDVLDILVEINIPTIGWVDITSDVRREDGKGVSGSDGTQGTQQRRASPSQLFFTINNRDGKYSPRNPASPYYRLLSINTQIRARVEGLYQFYGEVVSGWPTKWTTGAPDTGDAWVPLRAGGRSERINADTTPLAGPLYDLLATGIDYYWPLTDPTSATSAAPVTSTTGLTVAPRLYPWGLNPPKFAGTSGPPSSPSVPDFTNRGGLSAGLTDGLSGQFYVGVWFKLESGETADFGAMSLYQVRLNGTAGNVTGFDLVITAGLGVGTPGLNKIGITAAAYTGYPQGSGNRNSGMTVTVTSTPCTQDDWHFIRVVYTESGGAISQDVYLDGVEVGAVTGAAAGYSLEPLSGITLAANDSSGLYATPWTANSGVGLASLAHLVIQTDIIGDIGIYEAGTGYPGETAAARLARVLTAQGIGFDLVGDADDTATMTAQRYGGTLSSLLEDCARTDGGLLTDARDMLGLRYVTRVELYNRVPDLDLDYTAKAEQMPGLDVDESAFSVENDITATSEVGSYRAVQAAGTRNVNEPTDGDGAVGRYPGSLTTSLDTLAQLRDAAEWALWTSTADAPRFTSVPVSLVALAAAGKTSTWQAAAQVEPGGVIRIANTPIWIPDDVVVFAVGRSWRAANYEWDIAFNTVDATAWQDVGGPLEDTVYGRADSEDSFLTFGPSAGATQILVSNTGSEHIPTLWTHADGDFDIVIGDEQMTVTAVATETMSYLATGTAAYADNASVTPGLPGGGTGGGHLMVLFAFARSATTVVNTPAGWTKLPGMPGDNGMIAVRTHTGTESAPTVTFTGGSAGDTHGAVIASFQGLQARMAESDLAGVDVVGQSSTFGTSQNIDVPAFPAYRDNVAVMQFGAKADDWTSVATLSGGTEVYDGSSTLGSDLGLVWDWRTVSTRAAVAAQTFTVTGGTSVDWDSCIMLIDGNIQRLTVTRGVNDTTAVAHSAGDQVRLAHPMRFGR
jgi:hypothetical protein